MHDQDVHADCDEDNYSTDDWVPYGGFLFDFEDPGKHLRRHFGRRKEDREEKEEIWRIWSSPGLPGIYIGIYIYTF